MTGITTIPTCSGMLSVAAGTGKHGTEAVAELARLNVLHTGEGIMRCYDDHDKKHVFDLKRGHYTVAGYGNLFTGLVIAARRPGPDVLELSKYSYIVK